MSFEHGEIAHRCLLQILVRELMMILHELLEIQQFFYCQNHQLTKGGFMYQQEKEKELSADELMQRICDLQPSKTIFDKIIEAKSVQELIDLHLEPEEVFSLFAKAEVLTASYEHNYIMSDLVKSRLEKARPVKRKRAFFI